jgi:serine/threonine protein kinase
VLGSGGFGITYQAVEAFTERAVAIKEYLPAALAARDRDGHRGRPLSEGSRADFEAPKRIAARVRGAPQGLAQLRQGHHPDHHPARRSGRDCG